MQAIKAVTKSAMAIALTIGITAFAPNAHAIVVDFAQYAETNGEASVGEMGKASSYTNPLPVDTDYNPISGLLLSATGGVPYLDSFSGGERGGLGVCETTNSDAQCTPSSDDNITSGETVTIGLQGGGLFDFTITEFRDGDHNLILMSSMQTLLVGINGGGLMASTFGDEYDEVYQGITSITFGYGGSNANQFYLSAADITPVPEPGTQALFGLGLAGLGFARRKKTSA